MRLLILAIVGLVYVGCWFSPFPRVPFLDADELAFIGKGAEPVSSSVSPSCFAELRLRKDLFQRAVAFSSSEATLGEAPGSELVRTMKVSDDFFSTLGPCTVLGSALHRRRSTDRSAASRCPELRDLGSALRGRCGGHRSLNRDRRRRSFGRWRSGARFSLPSGVRECRCDRPAS